jgi:hypothetical protein
LFHNLSHKYDRQTLAGDNYHDQENAQFSYFPMGKIKKGKQSLQRRELVNGSEIRTFIEMVQQTEVIFYCGKKEDDPGGDYKH